MTTVDDRLRHASAAVNELLRDVTPDPQSLLRGRRRYSPIAITVGVAVVIAATVLVVASQSADDNHRVTTAAAPMPSEIVAWSDDFRLVVLSSSTGKVVRTLETNVALVRASPTTAVTPNGTAAYFSRSRRPRSSECPTGLVDEIARVPLAGGTVESVAPGVYPALSPDGRLLAYTRNSQVACGTDNDELVVRDLQTGAETTWRANLAGAVDLSSLSWAPDSTHLGYYRDDGSGRPEPKLLDLTTATSLDSATAIPHAPDTQWAGFLGITGTGLGVQHQGTSASSPVRVVQLDNVTGTRLRTLFTLPGGLAVSNVFDGPEDTLRADRSGRHIIAVGLLPLSGTTRRGALYRWSEGDAQPKLVAEGFERAAWLEPSTKTVPAPNEATIATRGRAILGSGLGDGNRQRGAKIVVAHGTHNGLAWQLLAYHSDAGLCVDLRIGPGTGGGCGQGVPPRALGVGITGGLGSGGAWVSGPVRADVARIRVELSNGDVIDVLPITSPDFDVNFFVTPLPSDTRSPRVLAFDATGKQTYERATPLATPHT